VTQKAIAVVLLVEGTSNHYELTVDEVLITGDRLTDSPWQYGFVVTPAP
jgi:hypothetical protein